MVFERDSETKPYRPVGGQGQSRLCSVFMRGAGCHSMISLWTTMHIFQAAAIVQHRAGGAPTLWLDHGHSLRPRAQPSCGANR